MQCRGAAGLVNTLGLHDGGPVSVASLGLEAINQLKQGWSALMEQRPEYGVLEEALQGARRGKAQGRPICIRGLVKQRLGDVL
jgi:hypothetical protein